ncbi:MAG TPA: diaminopimelate decarboxylase [Ruminococcaceae bacterium]|nr:diaminopimelate decarboxylase [Oscillospiraceae bacterium]
MLEKLSAQLATPSYIFDLDEFEKRARLVKKYFGEKTGICFSIKANPFLLGRLPDVFDKIEVCSPGELTICEKTGVDTSKIIFSGVNKTLRDVQRAADDEVGTFTAESLLHVEMINGEGVKRGKVYPVLLRVTDVKGGSQFGMEEATVLDIIKNRDSYKGMEIVGLHYFTGTQKKKAKPIERELDYLADLIVRVKDDLGFTVNRIEYGTGLAVNYFDSNADELEEERLASISEKIRELSEKTELTVEMGRFFAAPCGYYLTKVIDAKTNYDINYVIVDGGLNQLKYDGQLQGMQIPNIVHLKNSDVRDGVKAWTLCGSLCTTADILARGAEFDSLGIGDILVFCRTGAYSVTEGMAVFLSREMPVVSVYSEKDGLTVIRDMLYSDVFNTPKL